MSNSDSERGGRRSDDARRRRSERERDAERHREDNERLRQEVLDKNDVSKVGRLQVEVIEARDLLKADAWSKSDPFVELTLGARRKRTQVVKNSHEPEWREKFSFANIRTGDEALELACWDDDGGGERDPLGTVDVPLRDLEAASTVDGWYGLSLPGRRGGRKFHGEVHLRLQYAPPEVRRTAIAQEEGSRSRSSARGGGGSRGTRGGSPGSGSDEYAGGATDEGGSLFALGSWFGCCSSRHSKAERGRSGRRADGYGGPRGMEEREADPGRRRSSGRR
eukprot:TRINITY_DN2626_c1_g1_i1.p4 TRINITY_DN2626_c1_g1~~TRINITY_DN2626_c1_g1_i1.p4  ORF type:complete len:279 (-),score=95.80 TRINITY_DN2626_c1_g1_i1:51-887(-)